MRNRIKSLCKERGITIIELAERMGIARENLTRTIGEKGNPTLETVKKIAFALGVEPYELFTDLNLKESIQNKDFHGVIWVKGKPTIINSLEDLEGLIQSSKAEQS